MKAHNPDGLSTVEVLISFHFTFFFFHIAVSIIKFLLTIDLKSYYDFFYSLYLLSNNIIFLLVFNESFLINTE